MNQSETIIAKSGPAYKVFNEIRELAKLLPSATLGQIAAARWN